MNISIIGAGYVGLVTGACLADLGNTVICMDINAEKIAGLNKGVVPIVEDGLDALISRNLQKDRLVFTTDMEMAVDRSYLIMIAVDTPCVDGQETDLSRVLAVENAIAGHMNQDKLIINKSTVPIGTGLAMEERMNTALSDMGKECRVTVASNPEFLREGTGVYDFMNPDRLVIGFHNEVARKALERLYLPLIEKGIPVMFVDVTTAETIKFASNVFLALKIAYINEMSRLCGEVGANIFDVSRGMGMDNRIGRSFLRVGPGFGGSCFPKDTRALVNLARANGVEVPILESILPSNALQKEKAVDKIKDGLSHADSRRVALLGLSYKAGTGDVRESPALDIIAALLADGISVTAYDPAAIPEALREFPEGENLCYAKSAQEAVDAANVVVLATEWPEFSQLGFHNKTLVDLKNTLQSGAYQDCEYIGL